MFEIIKKNWHLFLYFILSVFAILPFFASGFFTVHDDTQVARIYVMAKSLSDGMFPVRWVQDLGYGFGYPIFNFYSVFPYYLGGIFVNFGLDVLLATKTVFIIAIIFSGISMFLLVKNFFGKTAGLVSAITYLYFPYHAVNTYIRGDLAEIFAYAFLPLVFLGFFKIHEKEGSAKFNIIISSAALSAVIISHNLSFVMAFLFVFLFAIFSLIFGKQRTRLAISYGAILIIAFLLSAFYSIPAIFEMKYSNVMSIIGGGSDFRDHFVCITQLWDSPWGFGGSAPGCIDGMSFKLGKINILLVGLAFVLFIIKFNKNKDKRFMMSFSFLAFIISAFMTLSYSELLWNMPFMNFLQFPWRFLNFAGLFIAMIAGFLIWQVEKLLNNRTSMILALIIILLTLFYNLRLFEPKTIHDRTSSYYTNEAYIKWTVSKISDEYLPHNFTKPKTQSVLRSSPIEIIPAVGTVEVLKNKTQELQAKINLEEDGTVRINKAFFPTWKVYVDEKNSPYIAGNDGLYLSLQKGQHNMLVRFVSTPVEKLANILSIVGLLILFTGIIGKLDFIFYGKKTS